MDRVYALCAAFGAPQGLRGRVALAFAGLKPATRPREGACPARPGGLASALPGGRAARAGSLKLLAALTFAWVSP